MNRLIRFSGYLLVGLLIFSIITVAIDGGGGMGGGEPLSGSSSNSTPSSTSTPPANRSDQYYEQKLADGLTSSNITVLSVATQDDAAILKYVPKKPNESAVVEEMGTIAIRYGSLVRDGWNVSQLEAKVIPPRKQPMNNSSDSDNRSSPSSSPSSNRSTSSSRSNAPNRTAKTNRTTSSSPSGSRQPVATWHVKTKWVKNMNQKNASKKYFQKILNSIEVSGGGSGSAVDYRGREPRRQSVTQESTTTCEDGADNTAPARVRGRHSGQEDSSSNCTTPNGSSSTTTTVVFGGDSSSGRMH